MDEVRLGYIRFWSSFIYVYIVCQMLQIKGAKILRISMNEMLVEVTKILVERNPFN